MLYTFLKKKKNIIILGIFVALLYIHLITKSYYIIIVYIILVIVCDSNCCRLIIICLGIQVSMYGAVVSFREAINFVEKNIKSISNCFSTPKVFDSLKKTIIPTETKAETIPLTTGERPVEDHDDEESTCSVIIPSSSTECAEGSCDSGEESTCSVIIPSSSTECAEGSCDSGKESMNDGTDGNTNSIIRTM